MTKTEQYALMYDESKQPKDVQTILAKANPDFREAAAEIESLLHKAETDTLRTHYRIGQLALQVRRDTRRFGDNGLPRLMEVFGCSKSTIANDVRLAEAFTPEQIQQFCETRLGNGHLIPYRHLTLIALLDPADRQPMIDEVVTRSLTAKDLETTIAVKKGLLKPKSKRGRLPNAPKDLKGAVIQLEGYAKIFLSRNEKVWAVDGHTLTDKAADLSSDEVTEERVEMVRKVAASLRLVAEQAEKRAKEAEAVHLRLKGIFERRQGLTPRVLTIEPASHPDAEKEPCVFAKDIVGDLPDAPAVSTTDPIYLYDGYPSGSSDPGLRGNVDDSTVEEESEMAMSA